MKKEITELLNGQYTAYQISKETGISIGNLQELIKGKRKIGNITLDTAEKLYNYYKQKKEIDKK